MRSASLPLVFSVVLAASAPANAADVTAVSPTPTTASPVPFAPAPVFDEDAPPRFSLPTESDRALWRKPGLRFGLSAVYGRIYGLSGAPDGQLVGPAIHAGVRLDEDWSLLASLQYLYATGGGTTIKGLRFAGTLEPTWHATEHLSLAAGVGFGGIVETSNVRPEPLKDGANSYTFPDASTPLASCSGVGVAGLLRAEWLMVIGPRAATGFALQVDGQWTACVEDTGKPEPDTAATIVRRQWWPHLGGALSWGILWR
jgi:hypothetical protein